MLTVRQVGDRSVNVHQEVDIVDPQTPFPRCYPARRFIEVNVRSAVPRRGLGNMAVSVHRQPLSLATVIVDELLFASPKTKSVRRLPVVGDVEVVHKCRCLRESRKLSRVDIGHNATASVPMNALLPNRRETGDHAPVLPPAIRIIGVIHHIHGGAVDLCHVLLTSFPRCYPASRHFRC